MTLKKFQHICKILVTDFTTYNYSESNEDKVEI